jgi:ABC-type branched-subunit amino acid transport system substrate-binding protein
MILAQNPRPLLNGNSTHWYVFIIFLALISCRSNAAVLNNDRYSAKEGIASSINHNAIKPAGVVISSDDEDKTETLVIKNTYMSDILNPANTSTFLPKGINDTGSFSSSYRIAFLLPFCLGEDHSKNDKIRQVMIEYFEGAETALHWLHKQGYKVIVDVYDTKKDSLTTVELLRNQDLAKADLIIGPIFEVETQIMENFCSIYQIPMVNPLRQYDKSLRTSNHVFNPVIVDSNIHYFAGLEMIHSFPQMTFYLLNDHSAENFKIRKAFLNAFELKNTPLKYITEESIDAIFKSANPSNPIMMIAPISSESLVQKLLSKGASNAHVHLLGMESWFDFPIIPFQLWKKNNLYFYNQMYIDHQSDENVEFKELYVNQFGGKPGRYAYLGYDHTRFFVEALCTFGSQFGEHLKDSQFPMLHNSFLFKKDERSVFNNTMVNLLQVHDFYFLKVR